MRIFVYEYITGGGLWDVGDPASPSPSLFAEGALMIEALAADFVAAGHQVHALRDSRAPRFPLPASVVHEVASSDEEYHAYREQCHACDGVVVIAPEVDGLLLDRALLAVRSGARLLSPPPEFIRIASDKHLTAVHLAEQDVPVPYGQLLHSPDLPEHFPYPAVLKRCDGAGSISVQRVAGPKSKLDERDLRWPARLEEFREGRAASVALLCGPAGCIALPACDQHLQEFHYLGGKTPLPEPLNRRAQQLALAALEALPPARGYVGVDLILGADSEGRQDVVIEINPRLTTSYVGLRRLARQNLAQAMIDMILAGQFVDLQFGDELIEFALPEAGPDRDRPSND